MNVRMICCCAVLLPSLSIAWGQTTPASPVVSPAAPAAPAPGGTLVLHDGDDIDLKFLQSVSSKTANDGDPINFELADDLKIGGVVVAKAGAKAVGEVTHAQRAGMMGKAGELNIRINYLRIGDMKVRLRGSKGKEGQSGQTSAIVLTVLFGPLGLIKHGKEVDIKEGTPLKVYADDNYNLQPVPPS